MNRFGKILKRSLDVILTAVVLPGLSPILVLIAILIRLDSQGPVLFRQERLGKGGRVFRIVKFRTMWDGASVRIDPTGMLFNEPDDVRHTRVGRFLRRYSLDELPQLVNVLMGEMSLVGPRPDLPEALRYYNEHQHKRLSVRPGITGLAQITGRNEQSVAARWDLDAEYATTVSLYLDMKILWKTVWQVLRGAGVYGSTGRQE